MSCQGVDLALQVDLGLAGGAADGGLEVAVRLEQMPGDVVGVEEDEAAEAAGEDAPQVRGHQVHPHRRARDLHDSRRVPDANDTYQK